MQETARPPSSKNIKSRRPSRLRAVIRTKINGSSRDFGERISLASLSCFPARNINMVVAGTKDPRENRHETKLNHRRICGSHCRICANRSGSSARWRRVHAGEFQLVQHGQLIERCEKAPSLLKKLGQSQQEWREQHEQACRFSHIRNGPDEVTTEWEERGKGPAGSIGEPAGLFWKRLHAVLEGTRLAGS